MRDGDLRPWKALVRERANREWRQLSLEVVDELACHLADLHAAAIRDGASDVDARQMALDTLNAASFLELSKRPRARLGGGYVHDIRLGPAPAGRRPRRDDRRRPVARARHRRPHRRLLAPD